MEMDIVNIMIQLGLGGGILYVYREASIRADKRIDDRDKAFVKFVTEHNDAMAKLVVESTSAIKASTTAIKEASSLICKVSNKIDSKQ